MQSGIYKIQNKINNKVYVGSCLNFYRRKIRHFIDLKNGEHHNKHLQRSFDKHGRDAFEFIVLEKVDRKTLLKKEQYYMDILNPEYNIQRTAVSNLGVKFTEEHKRKMSISMKAYYTKYPVTEEEKARLLSLVKGRKHSEEEKIKRANSNNKPIYQFDLKGNFIKKWASTIAVKHALGYDTTQICKCIKSIHPSAHGYIWSHSRKLDKDDKRLCIKRIKEVQQLDIKTGEIIRTFEQVKDAELFLGIPDANKNISQVFKGVKKSAYGYKWKRIYQ